MPAWPEPALFLLRQALFLCPLAGTLLLARRTAAGSRLAIGALFALLYGLAVTFVGHVAAIHWGAWSYGGDTLEVLGFPADIWFGGALLWGPAMFLLAPRMPPPMLVAPCLVIHLVTLTALPPLFVPGPGWMAAVVAVFLTAHLPALYLARWTAADIMLPGRAFLLAVGHGCTAYFLLPTMIMQAMGGAWSDLGGRPGWMLLLAGAAMLVISALGVSAVQLFAVHGEGTPIPLDPTRRLVRTGLYAYLRNPMQVATAAAWLVIGLALGNVWVALAAVMAVCFVVGLVRWHHRQDLERRFPIGWAAYQAAVPEWLPRWRPWLPEPARLAYDPARHARLVAALRGLGAHGVEWRAEGHQLAYREPGESRVFTGWAALAKALNHINFAWAFIGAVLLLLALPLAALRPRR